MADQSLTILGPVSATAGQISSWAKTNGHTARYVSASITQLAGWYVQEGLDQGVRGDVAFAQACEETGYFGAASAAQLLAHNNFAGINVPSDSSPGDVFATPQLGVRAHIQLLAKVVSGNDVTLAHTAAQTTADHVESWGSSQHPKTWGGLGGTWAADTTYGSKILAIYNSILGASPVLASGPGSAPITTTPISPGAAVSIAAIPGIDPTWKAPVQVTASSLSWFFSGADPVSLAAAVTTDSTVDLTSHQLSQVQLTIVDPTLDLTGNLPGLIAQDGTPGPQVLWAGETMAVEETQTSETNDIPAMIVTLRPSVLAWMTTQRRQGTFPQTNCDWIRDRVAEFNSQLGDGLTPATFAGKQNLQTDTIILNTPAPATQWSSYYDTATQLATQDGYWLIETAGGVFYGPPTWFALQWGVRFSVNWPGLPGYPNRYSQPGATVQAIHVPVCLRSDQLFTGDTCVLQLPHDIGEQVRVGMVFTLTGVPYFATKQWIVTEVQWNFDAQQTPVQVTANEVKDPVASNLNGSNAPALPPMTDPTGNPVKATASDFIAFCEQEVGKAAYVYGATPAAGNPDPSAFDCSSLVQWALAQLGVPFPRISGEQYSACAAAGLAIPIGLAELTPGALVFLGPGGSEHVAVSLGTGSGTAATFVEAANSRLGVISGRDSSSWSVAAKIPGLNYPGSGS